MWQLLCYITNYAHFHTLQTNVTTSSGIDLWYLLILKSAALESEKGFLLSKTLNLCTRNLYIYILDARINSLCEKERKNIHRLILLIYKCGNIVCGHTNAAHHTILIAFSKKCFLSYHRGTMLFLKHHILLNSNKILFETSMLHYPQQPFLYI